MAEAEVNIKYQVAPVAALSLGLSVVVPLGAVYLLWSSLVLFLAMVDAHVQSGRAMLFILAQCVTWVSLVGLSFLARDKQVFLSKDGVSLPFMVLPGRIPRTQLSWSALSAVKFDSNGAGKLILWFGKQRAEFHLEYLGEAELEQLIVALDVWADGADRFPALLEARTRLPNQRQIAGGSFTDMWEEELARRFGATNFIPLEPGHKLRDDELIVERQMAFGGASAIYLVRDEHNQKFVVKEAVVPSDSDEDLRNKSVEMLQREATYLRALDHPDLAKVLDYFVDEGRHYLVMEYIDGIDLRRLVKEKGARQVGEVVRYAEQIADIIVYLHAQKPPLIHRDLTPDNIIVRDDGRITVIDFGASNHFIGTATQTLIGKQAYMPAEQLRGKTDQRSDIYSLGATIFFLLTGADPEPLSVSHPKQLNAECPNALDRLVAECTQLEPADRPQTMESVARQLSGMKTYAN